MKQTKIIMGMPITVEITDAADRTMLADTFEYFISVDRKYSTYKSDSEISRINAGLPKECWSAEMRTVMQLCEQTKQQTDGFFDIKHNDKLDPSGLVKGWAINNAAKRLMKKNVKNFYIEAGGDIQVHGVNREGKSWLIGIRNPFNLNEIIKTIAVSSEGVATSGTYVRGQHIYNPHRPNATTRDIESLTVIGSNIYEADRFATAAFAMGRHGIEFIEKVSGLEAYMVDSERIATYTSGFERYVA